MRVRLQLRCRFGRLRAEFRVGLIQRELEGLKLKIQKTKIMASGPIALWEINWEIVETVSDFIFLGSKITAGGDCRISHVISA